MHAKNTTYVCTRKDDGFARHPPSLLNRNSIKTSIQRFLYNDFGQYDAREGDMPTGNYWVIFPMVASRLSTITMMVTPATLSTSSTKVTIQAGHQQIRTYKPGYKNVEPEH